MLNKSIEHWVRMRDITDWDDPDIERPNAENCALCMTYSLNDCIGCPVAIKTRNGWCYGTPYVVATHKFRTCHSHPTWENKLAWSHAAQQMIDFLEELRK